MIDETQGQVGIDATNSSVFPQDPIDPRNDRGPADFDVRHVLTMNVAWELPFGEQLTGLAGAFARGWQINGLGVLRSGVPFSPSIVTGVNWSRSGNVANGAEDRPNLRPGVTPEDIVLGGPDQYFDPNAFVLQPRGFLGNAGRNMLRGPGFVNVDLSAVKHHTWHLGGKERRDRVSSRSVQCLQPAELLDSRIGWCSPATTKVKRRCPRQARSRAPRTTPVRCSLA